MLVLMDDAVWSIQVLKGEEVVIEKSAWGHLIVMEMLKYTCVPSFTSMHCMVC